MSTQSRARRLVASAALVASALAAAPRASAAEGRAAAPQDDRGERHRREDAGPLDPFRVGALGGVGLPRPLSIEGLVKVDDLVAVGLEYGAMPTVTVEGVDVRFNAIAADVRVFPLRSGFFFGTTFGQQHIGATTTIVQRGFAFPEEVSADSWFFNPRIGFLTTLSWGLTLGIDMGVQIPVSASFTNTIPTQLGSANQTATDVAHFFGKSVLPTVDLLKLGFLL